LIEKGQEATPISSISNLKIAILSGYKKREGSFALAFGEDGTIRKITLYCEAKCQKEAFTKKLGRRILMPNID